MPTFYERFKILLNENPDMKQQDISIKANIDKTSISKYCNAKAVPDAKNLLKLSELFNVSPTWLSGEDVPRQQIHQLTKPDTIYNNENEKQNNITFDDFTYAMYNESRNLSEEQKQALLNMAKLFKKTLEEEKEDKKK